MTGFTKMYALQATIFLLLGACARARLHPRDPDGHGGKFERRDVFTGYEKPVYLVTETRTLTQTRFVNPGIDVVKTSKVTATTYLKTASAIVATLPCTTNLDANSPPPWAVSTITTYVESVDRFLYTLDHTVTSSALTYTVYDTSWVTAATPLTVKATACANTLVWSHVAKETATKERTVTHVGRYETSTTTEVCMMTILSKEEEAAAAAKKKSAEKPAPTAAAGPKAAVNPFESTTLATTVFSWTKTETPVKTKDIPTSTTVTTVCNNPTYSKDVYRTRTNTAWKVTTLYTLGRDCAGKSSGAKPTPRAVVEQPANLDATVIYKREEECGFENSAGKQACYKEPPTTPGVYTSTFWVVAYHDTAVDATTSVVTSTVTVCEMPVFGPTITESAGP
jgi:hypothetical protein